MANDIAGWCIQYTLIFIDNFWRRICYPVFLSAMRSGTKRQYCSVMEACSRAWWMVISFNSNFSWRILLQFFQKRSIVSQAHWIMHVVQQVVASRHLVPSVCMCWQARLCIFHPIGQSVNCDRLGPTQCCFVSVPFACASWWANGWLCGIATGVVVVPVVSHAMKLSTIIAMSAGSVLQFPECSKGHVTYLCDWAEMVVIFLSGLT